MTLYLLSLLCIVLVHACPIHAMREFLIGDVSGNGVTSSTLRCHDEIEGILWTMGTRLCYLAHAGIEVASHDPLWNNTNVLSTHDPFLCYLPISYQKTYISDQIIEELHSKVAKRITFEEQVTDININRLQEVVDKWLYLTIPIMMSAIYWATYVIPIESERYTILNVGQVINRIRIDRHIALMT
jgi:hypothetical protein